MFNTTAQSEPSSAFKTAKMDDAESSETGITASSSSQEAETTAEKEQLQSEVNEVPCDEGGAEVTDEVVGHAGILQNPSCAGPSSYERIANEPSPEQYIPLIQLMQSTPKSPSQVPRPSRGKPKKAPKGRNGKGCYHQLAESLAVELATMNEKLHKKLRNSFDELQGNEPDASQGLGELEDDSYVFVHRQGDLLK